MQQEQMQPRRETSSQEDNIETLRAKYGVIKISLAGDLNMGFIEWDERYGKVFEEYAKKDLLLLEDFEELGTRDKALNRIKEAIYH